MKTLERRLALGLILAVFALGAWLRFAELGARDLWHDEAWLALDVLNDRWQDALFFSRAEYGNSTPVLYTFGLRAVVALAGSGETALRFLPALLSFLALPVVLWLAREGRWPLSAAIIAAALFAFNRQALFFSQELKQYSADALAPLIILVLGARWRRAPASRALVYGSMASAALYALSHTAVLAAVPMGLGLLLGPGDRDRRKAFAGVALVHAAVLLALYFGLLRQQRNPGLMRFWHDHFPYSMRPGDMASFFGHQSWRFLVWHFKRGVWKVMAVLWLLGALTLLRRDRRLLIDLLAPVALGLFVAALKLYPFSASRICFYLEAAILLPIAWGFSTIIEEASRRLAALRSRGVEPLRLALRGLLIVAVVVYYAGRGIKKSGERAPKDAARAMVSALKERRRPGDLIVLDGYYVSPAFDYYARDMDAGDRLVIPSTGPEELALSIPSSARRVWIVSSHFGADKRRNRIKAMRRAFEARGCPVWEGWGALLILWRRG